MPASPTKRIRLLNDGNRIPCLGLGTYEVSKSNSRKKRYQIARVKRHGPGEVENAVKEAIAVGYRYFDCAWIDHNESEVGRAINAKIAEGAIERGDVFVATKLWNNFHRREKVVEMLERSLLAMNLSYVDAYLIHWPMAFKENSKTLPLDEGGTAYANVDYVETWKGMEDCLLLGYARSIGVANFNSRQIERIIEHAEFKPVINQVEVHPYFAQADLIGFCKSHNIKVVAYCPFGINEKSGSPNFPEPTIVDERIEKIACKHGKTAAQVVLRYLITHLNVIVVPKAVAVLRIKEFWDISDFRLDAEDVALLQKCNRNERMLPMSAFSNHVDYPFNFVEPYQI